MPIATGTPLDILRTYRAAMVTTVSDNDQMVLSQDALDADTLPETDWARQYFWVTEEALRCIAKAMVLGEKTTFRRILDLPCGHGRVLRGLRAAFPAAEITACDIDRDGVDFCARTFGARPVYGDADPDRIDLGDARFDLIYCGSLLTHLDQDLFRRFLRMMSRHLARDGLLVFTTHGRWCITFHRTVLPFTDPVAWQAIEAGYRDCGFGYRDYAATPGYGVSLTSIGWVQQAIDADPSLTTIGIAEKGLGNYQDVFVCQKWPIDDIYGPMHPKTRPAIYRGRTEVDGPPAVERGPRRSGGFAPELHAGPDAPAPAAMPPAAPDRPLRGWLRRLLGGA
ncbi:hypothetical protein STHU_01770 [Allostella humosa]|nr:hypothetical protein STHU_01770 [Stella humosa]